MDAYLESLVKKEAKAEQINEEVIEQVAEESDSVEEVAEPVVEATEPVVENVQSEKVEEKVEEVVEKASDEKKENKGKTPKQPSTKSDLKGQTIAVTNIRVHNIPDPKSVFKIISGNVIVGDMINNMYQIDYVKPGFGLVKGFTSDLK